jgi:hypothetical protein
MARKPPTDNRAYAIEWANKQLPAPGRLADPFGTGITTSLKTGKATQLVRGRVVDAVAYAHCYRVLLPDGYGPRMCVLGAHTGFSAIGAIQLNTLTPGAVVWVALHPQLNYGVIMAVEPHMMTDPRLGRSDFWHQSSRAGIRVDTAHQVAFRGGQVINWSADRPLDSLMSGEWGYITETGLRVAMDSFMVQVAADEATGLFVFYHDQLLRLAGVNFQEFSSGHSREWLQDGCEIYGVEGHTPYAWEQMGLTITSGSSPPVIKERDAEANQRTEPEYSAYEPTKDDQLPFHRVRHFRGYLGQGEKRTLQAPKSPGLCQLEHAPDVGLFDEQLSLTGELTVSSAKGIHLVKRLDVQTPKQKRRPEDPEGDKPTDYRFAGKTGSGDAHKVKGARATTHDQPHLQAISSIFDLHGDLFNWQGMHAFHYHKSDWQVDSPTELEDRGVRQNVLDFDQLKTNMYLPRPEAVQIPIDHRYGEVDYFPNCSFFSLLDDGGVVIGDGYGAEIRMTGGQIYLQTAGDIFLQSGRNIVNLAGHDLIAKAKYSMDFTTSTKDIRIRSEQATQIMAGNGGYGALLLQCKADRSQYKYADKVGEDVESGGIHIKANTSDVAVYGNNLYLRSLENGQINLDADAGEGQIIVNAGSMTRYLRTSANDYLGPDTQIVNSFGPSGASFGTGLTIHGHGLYTGGCTFGSYVNIRRGHIATEFAEAFAGKVGTIEGTTLTSYDEDTEQRSQTNADAIESAKEYYTTVYTEGWYDDERAGHTATIGAIQFSHRSPEQLMTENFHLTEARWQQLLRAAGGGVPWSESRVTNVPEPGSYAYPGFGQIDAEAYYEQDLKLFDPQTGKGVDAAANQTVYTDAEYPEPTAKTLQEGYIVIS